MKIKDGFVLREMCGENIVAGEGLEHINFNKLISLNSTAAFLWQELVGKELFIQAEAEESDEFYMEDLIGFSVVAGKLKGEIVDYYDSEINPLFGIDFGEGEVLVPAAEEFIAHIDFEKGQMKMVLPEGLLEL